jgi:hypothetical protein
VIDPGRSYARKCLRAKKHLDELKRELAVYEGRHPYVAVRDRNTNPNPRAWTYRAHLAKKPSPDLALIVGDAIHNLRTALDYVVAELVPPKRRRKCKFPVIHSDILATDPQTGEYLDRSDGADGLRSDLESALRGMNMDAAGFLYSLQPGKAPYLSAEHPLAILSALDDADKHRELTAIARGIKDPVTVLTYRDEFSLTQESEVGDVVEEGGVVAQFIIRPRDLKAYVSEQGMVELILAALADGKAKVDVKITGSPQVALKIRGVKGLAPLPRAIEDLGSFVWDETLTTLDWYVQVAESGGTL